MPANRTQDACAPLLSYRQILHESPITAGVDVNIADALCSDDHVRLIPERKHRHIATDDVLGLRVQRCSLRVIVSVRSFRENRIEFRVAVTAAIPRRWRPGGNLW